MWQSATHVSIEPDASPMFDRTRCMIASPISVNASLNSVLREQVIVIQERHEFARCEIEPRVSGGARPKIARVVDHHDAVILGVSYLHRLRREVIDDENFKISVGLRGRRRDGFF